MVWSVRSLGLSLYWPGFLGAEERAGLLFEACAVCIRNMQGLYPTVSWSKQDMLRGRRPHMA